MSLCDTCREPGYCCHMFALNIYARVGSWREEMQLQLDQNGLGYMTPITPGPLATQDTERRVNGFFSCTRLGADGRCSNYDDRPTLCRDYEAGSDPLCVEHVYKLCGIPIVVVAS